ncbi:MAG: hypothetical protein LBE92_07330 [Chryseobacterium sp.]|uniref:hypothetical protein n=1 Tax=Chryseobacterium sp. TaxID=1871047 RepID=UPI0028283898|nr:hypothetical protein [Chryseobacterium sp.]MDR2235919.1 hypothetical protein [Chryseobacterium sp.]
MSFTISNRAKCYDETSNNKYYLIYKGRSLELSHDSNDGYKMYLIRDLANFYSDIVSKKKNKSGEDFLFVNEKDLKRFFINFSRESYIVSENNCKIYFSRESKVKIQYNEIFWHYPR